jgi:hypothetical protein
MSAKNLFSKAKQAAPTKTEAKDKKVHLMVTDPDFFNKVQKLEQLNDTLKSAKAAADMISDELRDVAKTEWANHYQKTGRNPDSVLVCQNKGEDAARIQFIPMDKYITITENRANELREMYGEQIVEEETTFSFDSAMIDKYGEVLSNLIENCADIADADREKIIKAVTKYSVAKGTIDKLNQYGDVQEVMENVKPVVALKNIEVIKG